jgi:acetate kinase
MDRDRVGGVKPIPIAISARHVHLSQDDVDVLFGKGHQLTPRTPLSQPGQFACVETVSLVGPKRYLDNVRIIGPVRKQSQVEISRTDEFHLGLDAPIRASGELANSPGITITGPNGQVTLKEGVIQSQRHIHMHPDDAKAYGVADGDEVQVKIAGGPRDLTFGDVVIRVSPKFKLEMHIDTDEANAAELPQQATGELSGVGATASLVSKRSTRKF